MKNAIRTPRFVVYRDAKPGEHGTPLTHALAHCHHAIHAGRICKAYIDSGIPASVTRWDRLPPRPWYEHANHPLANSNE